MAVVATGFFDGVHLGHRKVLSRLVELARSRGEESVVVTFWPHPRTVLQQDARTLRLLTSLDEKREALGALGVDRVEVLDFTRSFSMLSTKEYISDFLIGRFGASALVLGYDNRMGNSCSDPSAVASEARELGLEVYVEESISGEDMTAISSTRIRAALEAGDVAGASAMLGYDYSLRGVVVAGNRLGRTLGFPTANMKMYDPLKIIPGCGSYLVRVEVVGGKYYGMCNVGVKPTVASGLALTIETNIFGFLEDIYGLDIKVTFLERIRPERKFSGLGELKSQLLLDRAFCEKLILN